MQPTGDPGVHQNKPIMFPTYDQVCVCVCLCVSVHVHVGVCVRVVTILLVGL